jgi:transcriptional regulator with PAS, ATPase and Fis domain
MAAIPTEVAESELFGHRAGAFTGATRDRAGLVAQASGGTLFLDEVNAMPLALQAKLLRVIEARQVRAVGSDVDRPVNFRLVCAANEPLDRAVEEGRFRRDLLHRIRVASLTVPPLRERLDDLPLLAAEFLERHGRTHGRHLREIAPEVLEALGARAWPGNVRELENWVEQLVIFAPDGSTVVGFEALAAVGGEGAHLAAADRSLAAMEARYVRAVLHMARGNKTQAARILDIDYKTLLRKIRDSAH